MYSRYDGKIDDADEPLEMNPGGLVCVCTNNLTKIELTLKPDGLPGKATLSATEGGGLIRVWENPNRTDQVTLPKTWNAGAQPGALYIEGVAPSSKARDVELKLEYDETPQGDNSGLFRCEDRVKLTVIRMELKEGSTIINEGGYVYITGTPQMPQLEASLKPAGLLEDARWQLYIEYTRPDRGGYTGDKEYYPGPNAIVWKTLSAAGTWDIAA